MFIAGNEKARIPLQSTHVGVNILNSVAEITLTQRYLNEEKTPIEAMYKFPTNADFAVT